MVDLHSSKERMCQGRAVSTGSKMSIRERSTRGRTEVRTSWSFWRAVHMRGFLPISRHLFSHCRPQSCRDLHLEPCREWHAWLFGSGMPRPRIRRSFQVLELVSFNPQAEVFHSCSRRSWHALACFFLSLPFTAHAIASRHVFSSENFHWRPQSCRDLHLDQGRGQDGLPFGTCEPRLRSEQRVPRL